MDAHLKVSRAIIKLVTNYPFYGSCALRLSIQEDENTETMSTDGRSIFWGRKFVDNITEENVLAVIAHEVLHVVWLHHLRIGDKKHTKWNVATDYAINGTLIEDGFKFPEGVLLDNKYKNMNAEKIYNLLKDSDYPEPTWGQVTQMQGKGGKPLTGDELSQAKDEIEEMIASAANAAKKAGKEINGSLSELVKNVRTPQVNWKAHLRTTLMSNKPDNPSWRKPNRKMLSELEVYMPSMVSESIGVISVVLDTSASVSRKEREVYLSELQSINESMRPLGMNVICVDTEVATCYSFTPDDDISELKLTGGGGTDMTPGFKYIEECLDETETILCFSDCEFWQWPPEPMKQVIWLSTGEENNPYGTLIKVKH